MATVTAYPHIAVDADGTARLSRIPRVRVSQIAADHLYQGWSAEEICRQYGYLPAEVHSALSYFYDHADAVTAELEAEQKLIEADQATIEDSPLRQRLRKQIHGG